MDKFDEKNPKLFDVTTLKEDDFNTLLTTWKVYYVSGYNPKIKLESIGDNIKSPVTYKLYQDGSLIYTGSISLSQTVIINQFSSSSTTRKIVFE
jgi:hypothetical protein